MNSNLIWFFSLVCIATTYVNTQEVYESLEPYSPFVKNLLETVKDQIMNRDATYVPGVMNHIIKAKEIKSTDPKMRLYVVRFVLNTYVPGHPELKMYRWLYCEANIATFSPLKMANRLESLECSKNDFTD